MHPHMYTNTDMALLHMMDVRTLQGWVGELEYEIDGRLDAQDLDVHRIQVTEGVDVPVRMVTEDIKDVLESGLYVRTGERSGDEPDSNATA